MYIINYICLGTNYFPINCQQKQPLRRDNVFLLHITASSSMLTFSIFDEHHPLPVRVDLKPLFKTV